MKTRDELVCSGRVCSSCSTTGILRITLVNIPMGSLEWEKGDIGILTRGTYQWSRMTQTFRIRLTKHKKSFEIGVFRMHKPQDIQMQNKKGWQLARQIMVHKTLHGKLMIEQYQPHQRPMVYSGVPNGKQFLLH